MVRKLLFAAVAAVFMVSAAAAQDWARQMFATTNHDFGSVARGAKAEFAFELTNNFQGDVHLASVRASCGCTTPRIEKEWLKTYEKGAIIAHLNSDRYQGHRRATITVTIDQPAFAEVQLDITAYVHDSILMEPAAVELGTVEQGTRGLGKVILYRADMPDWRILDVKLSNPALAARAVEVARQDGQVWYELRVGSRENAPAGYISDYAWLTTNDPNNPTMSVAVEGQVQSDVVVSPASLFLGVLRPGEKVTKTLVVRGKTPFRVTGITADRKAFQFPKPGGEAKTLHVIPVTFVAGADWGKVVKDIRVQTDRKNVSVTASSYAVVEPESSNSMAKTPPGETNARY
jgi:hypothetical protein